MLRNRSRAVTSKQTLMADLSSQASPAQNCTKPNPSFFDSPRFKAFTSKAFPDTESLKSPTSILDNKPFFPFGNPFALDRNHPKSSKPFSPNNTHTSPANSEPKGIALAIVDTFLNKNQTENKSCCEASNKKKVLFGTELRVQIPPILPPSLVSPTTSPTDFGIKTRNSHLTPAFASPNYGIHMKDSPRVFNGCLPVREMELSEDYTCVISHGPNPRTTHIFDNCVVENYCSVLDNKPKPAPESFLSFCHTCKKNLQQKIDIYIYRGEKAFCSQECRHQEMLLDGDEN